MTPQLAVFVIFTIGAVKAGLIPTVEVLQGPGSRTRLLGPDGSALSAIAPGGTVVTNDGGSGLVAAGPALLAPGPELLINGPAGSIATINTLGGPAIVPAAIAAPAAITAPVGLARAGVLTGESDGSEGAYVADTAEALYDDGSYRGEH